MKLSEDIKEAITKEYESQVESQYHNMSKKERQKLRSFLYSSSAYSPDAGEV